MDIGGGPGVWDIIGGGPGMWDIGGGPGVGGEIGGGPGSGDRGNIFGDENVETEATLWIRGKELRGTFMNCSKPLILATVS